MINFIQATTDQQLTTVAALAKEIWTEYFTLIIGSAQVTYMLENIQSYTAIKKQVAGGYQYYLIELEKSFIGYLCLKPGEQDVFLSKLYILKSHRGSGVGKNAFLFIEQYAHEHHLTSVWLTVNKGNTDTIEAYKKWGFRVTEELVTDIGGGFVMDDYKMRKVI